MAFYDEIRYELWELGWDGVLKTMILLGGLILFFGGLTFWGYTYPLRRSIIESNYDSEVLGHISGFEKQTTIRETFHGNYCVTLGWKIEYGFILNDSLYSSKTFIPKPRNKEMEDFVKYIQQNWRWQSFTILYDSESPEQNTLKTFGNEMKGGELEGLIGD